PDAVPTLGDWFRAGGYETHYRGKWHISHADLLVPGTHDSLMASDGEGGLIPDNVDAYRRADRLDPYGFSGWIGREPHGAARADAGAVRDGVFGAQVVELFGELAAARREGPWLAVASFVNPHDIAFSGFGWDQILQMPPPGDDVPDINEAPSQSDSFAGRPPCQEAWLSLWPKALYDQPADLAYRRLYFHLHLLVDRVIARVLESLEASGMADDTIVVFTSDHGDLLGAHGGLQQKWYNAYDEAIRVPLTIKGPGVSATADGVTTPTSHVDLVPTLLGLAGIDPEEALAGVAAHHSEARPLPGRDLSALVRGSVPPDALATPLYFMTEDDVSRGLSQTSVISGEPFESAPGPAKVESVIASLPGSDGGPGELWKLNHYYDRLDEWNAAHGIAANPFAPPPAEPFFELHNLIRDPEERQNLAANGSPPPELSQLQGLLESQREAKRLLPLHRNPA
ncbi:MAG TPA: sulfatase-like hydrolase/transferase, partial [Acidimicrobiales bacterium]|nr:sulfatase-like hydrolase/transferase [Acidimicrobiales bacterium]